MSNPAKKQFAVGEKIHVTVVDAKGATVWLGAEASPSSMAGRTEQVCAGPAERWADSRAGEGGCGIAVRPEGQALVSKLPPEVATNTMSSPLYSDSLGSGTHSSQARTATCQPGERIEIIAGPLRGLRGTVLYPGGAGQLLVAADGWEPGALIKVSERLLARLVAS